MYNYHVDIIWAVNYALIVILFTAILVIMSSALIRDRLWERRRRSLSGIKKDVYEMILSGTNTSPAACQPFTSAITPQQFIDISTNRNIEAAFFNDSEQQFLKSCFVNQEEVVKLEKTAAKSRNKWQRIEAILALGYTQEGGAVDILKKSLSSRDRDIVYFSIIALGQIKTVQSAKVLLDFLRKDPANSYKIVSILQAFPGEIAEEVVKLINYHDPLIRVWALKLLSKFASKEHLNKVLKLIHDTSAEARSAVCDCLGNIGGKEAITDLTRCLKDDSWLVRKHSVSALGKVMGSAAVPEIIGLINDASWSVLEAVKNVMTDHIETSLPYIEKFLESEYDIAKRYSVLALQDSGYIAKLLKDLAEGHNKDKTGKLLKGIIATGMHSGIDSALGKLDPSMQKKAMDALAGIE